MTHPIEIEAHPTPWRDVVVACRKCGKKLDDEGFGTDGDQTLPRALKSTLRAAGPRRDVRVVESKCLGLCPKKAVAVVLARNPGEILAVPPGTPAARLLDRLVPGV